MLPSVPVDTHLQMSCHREGDRRIGSIASVESWGGILDKDKKAIRSGQADIMDKIDLLMIEFQAKER